MYLPKKYAPLLMDNKRNVGPIGTAMGQQWISCICQAFN